MLLTQVVIIWWAEHFRDNASLIQAANMMWQKYYELFRNEKRDYSHPNNSFDYKSKVISDLNFKQIMNLYDEYKTKKK